MGQVLVRNLEDEVIDAIRLTAEAKGHSLEQELREIIRSAAQTTAGRVVAVERVRRLQKRSTKLKSEDLIRGDRDRRS